MAVAALIRRLGALRRFSRVARYAATTLLIVLAFATRWLLGAYLPEYPFLLFIPVVILVSLAFDSGTGLYATVLGAALGLVFFAFPEHMPARPAFVVALPLAVFILVGGFSAVVVEALRRSIDELEASDRHKALLLDELHHRVRNNLQSIISLLHLQARAVELKEVRAEDALRAAAVRVGVMGRVHGRLGRQGDAAGSIDAGSFIVDLCNDLEAALAASTRIDIRTDAQPVQMEIGRAILLGLIVNELVTNALKHAFAVDEKGRIDVVLRRDGPASAILEVRDDGRGIAPGTPGGLGRQLVKVLTASLGGQARLQVDGGTAVEVRFPAPAGH